MDLQNYIEKKEVTQTHMANLVGIKKAHMSLLVRGQRRPSPDLALRIQKATDGAVTVLELLYPKKDEVHESEARP